MKYAELLMIVIASFHGGSATLVDDFEEFRALLLSEQIVKLVEKYYDNDDQFRNIFLETQNSLDRKLAVIEISKIPEIEEFCQWVKAHATVSDPFPPKKVLQHSHCTVRSVAISNDISGWQGFAQEFKNMFPMEAWIELRERKVQRGGIFAEFYEKLLELKPIYERIQQLPYHKKYIQKLEELGVDYDEINQFIYKLNGWE